MMTHHLNIWTLVRYSYVCLKSILYRFHFIKYSNEWECYLCWLSAFFPMLWVCAWCVHVHLRCVNTHFHWNHHTTHTAHYMCEYLYELIFIAIWIFRKLSCSFHCRNAEIFVNGGKNCRCRNLAIIFRFTIPFGMTYISPESRSIHSLSSQNYSHTDISIVLSANTIFHVETASFQRIDI